MAAELTGLGGRPASERYPEPEGDGLGGIPARVRYNWDESKHPRGQPDNRGRFRGHADAAASGPKAAGGPFLGGTPDWGALEAHFGQHHRKVVHFDHGDGPKQGRLVDLLGEGVFVVRSEDGQYHDVEPHHLRHAPDGDSSGADPGPAR